MFLSLLLLIDISRAFILQTASLVGFFFVFFFYFYDGPFIPHSIAVARLMVN